VVGAREVLEHQRVEEGRAVVGGQADPLADPHADQARPHGMAGRLALRHVEACESVATTCERRSDDSIALVIGRRAPRPQRLRAVRTPR
jgi:hypothetical protein